IRAVVLTGIDDGYLAALDLHYQGVEVAALIDLRAAPGYLALREAVLQRQIKCLNYSTVYEALLEIGMRHVTGVEVRT
ncbi:hypothetical protein QN356_26515, partial [Pseudomonas sp. CCC3.1]